MHAEAEHRAACCELVSEVARQIGEVRLKLTGTSMLPAMWPGDEVTVRRCSLADLMPGQIVLYRCAGGLTAHRVLRTFHDRVVTRGDSVARCDAPIDPSVVVGFVSSVRRNQRAVRMNHTLTQRVIAALLRRSHLCLRIALRLGPRIAGNAMQSVAKPA